jgi:hypothetical protein
MGNDHPVLANFLKRLGVCYSSTVNHTRPVRRRAAEAGA